MFRIKTFRVDARMQIPSGFHREKFRADILGADTKKRNHLQHVALENAAENYGIWWTCIV